jgi:hypothetical protein
VLYGCRPSARTLWEISPTGKIEVNKDSILSYRATPDKNHVFAYVNDLEAMRSALT